MKRTSFVFFAVLACLALLSTKVAQADTECNEDCPRILLPVCGKRGRESREFSNECIWKYHNCDTPNDAYPEMKKGSCPEN